MNKKTLVAQVKDFINNWGADLVDVIDFCFVCDYSPYQVIDILTEAKLYGKEEIVDTLVDFFQMSRLMLEAK